MKPPLTHKRSGAEVEVDNLVGGSLAGTEADRTAVALPGMTAGAVGGSSLVLVAAQL